MDRRLERLFALTARAASHVSCRDPQSASAIEAWTGYLPRVYPDLAFAHPARLTPTTLGEHEKAVVIGVIGGDWENAYQGTRRIHTDYQGALRDVSIAVLRGGHRVLLTGGDEADIPVMNALRDAVLDEGPQFTDRVETAHLVTYEELTSRLAMAPLIVASRYHNLICALSRARPTISISYADKCTDLMRSVDMDTYAHDIRNIVSSELVASVMRALRDGPALSKNLQEGSAARIAAVHTLLDRALGGGLD